MILAWVWEGLCAAVAAIIGLFPDMEEPGWWGVVEAFLDGLATIPAFYYFIPLQAIAFSCVFLLAASTVAFAIWTGRFFLSVGTGGGGAT